MRTNDESISVGFAVRARAEANKKKERKKTPHRRTFAKYACAPKAAVAARSSHVGGGGGGERTHTHARVSRHFLHNARSTPSPPPRTLYYWCARNEMKNTRNIAQHRAKIIRANGNVLLRVRCVCARRRRRHQRTNTPCMKYKNNMYTRSERRRRRRLASVGERSVARTRI